MATATAGKIEKPTLKILIWEAGARALISLEFLIDGMLSVWYHLCSLHDSVILLDNRAAELGHKIKNFPEDEEEKISYIGSKRHNMKYDCICCCWAITHSRYFQQISASKFTC